MIKTHGNIRVRKWVKKIPGESTFQLIFTKMIISIWFFIENWLARVCRFIDYLKSRHYLLVSQDFRKQAAVHNFFSILFKHLNRIWQMTGQTRHPNTVLYFKLFQNFRSNLFSWKLRDWKKCKISQKLKQVIIKWMSYCLQIDQRWSNCHRNFRVARTRQ